VGKSALMVSGRAGLIGAHAPQHAEGVTSRAKELIAEADDETEHLQDLAELASPVYPDEANASKQYYPLTYFVDKKIESQYSVCGGSTVKKPIVETTLDGCARACDADVHECVGFSFFSITNTDSLCFLFSKFDTLLYVMDCPAANFLQAKRAASTSLIQCFGKLSEFPSSIAPDASGKCEGCLKKTTKVCSS